MYNEDEMHEHKKGVLMDLLSKMKQMSAEQLQHDGSDASNDELVSDEIGGNAHEPANEEESEDKSELSHQDREDAEHDDMNAGPEASEANHEDFQRASMRSDEGHVTPEDEAEEDSPAHPALSKLLREHMKRK